MAAGLFLNAKEQGCCSPGRGSQAPLCVVEEILCKEPFSCPAPVAVSRRLEVVLLLSGTLLIVAFLFRAGLCPKGKDCLFCEPQNSLLFCKTAPASIHWCRFCLVPAVGREPVLWQGTTRGLSCWPRAGCPVGDFPCSRPRWWGDWDQECSLLNEKCPFWLNSKSIRSSTGQRATAGKAACLPCFLVRCCSVFWQCSVCPHPR